MVKSYKTPLHADQREKVTYRGIGIHREGERRKERTP